MLIRPYEEQWNLRSGKNSKNSFKELLAHVNFFSKTFIGRGNILEFYSIHFFNSKGYIGKVTIVMKSSKIHMNFL